MGGVSESKSYALPGWGNYQPAEAVRSIDELRPGDVVLQRSRPLGFTRPCLHVLEVIGGDPSGHNRPLVRARLLDPEQRMEHLGAPAAAWVVLWDFNLTEGRTEWFRPASH